MSVQNTFMLAVIQPKKTVTNAKSQCGLQIWQDLETALFPKAQCEQNVHTLQERPRFCCCKGSIVQYSH